MLSLIKSYLTNYQGLPKTCWQRIFVAFINTISGGIIYFLSIYFVQQLHFNLVTAGFILSFYGVGTTLGGIGGGKLADNFSPTVISAVSLFLKAIGFLMLAKLKSAFWLATTLFLLGLTTYSFIAANSVWILNQCRHHEAAKLKAINILYIAANFGLGAAGVIIGMVAQYGFQYIFYTSSFLLFAAVCYLILAKPITIDWPSTADAQTNDISSAQVKANPKILWVILSCLFLTGLTIAQIGTTYSIYLEQLFPSFGTKSFGLLFALNSVCIVLFQAPLVNYFRQNNKMLVAGAGAFCLGFGMLLLNFSFIFLIAGLACIIYTIGEMLFIATAQLICYQYGGEKKKGQSLGLFQTTYALSVVVGPSLGGFIYHHLGGDIVWYCSGMIGVVCLLICLRYRKFA